MAKFIQPGSLSLSAMFGLMLFGASCDADGPADGDAGEPVSTDAGTSENHDTYVPGLEKAGVNGQILVRLQEAVPAPPEEGENRWVVEVQDGNGSKLDDATVTLTPWMPVHGHGTNPANYAGHGGDELGAYQIDSFVLTMPGVWELKIRVVVGESIADEVIFEFMIEG